MQGMSNNILILIKFINLKLSGNEVLTQQMSESLYSEGIKHNIVNLLMISSGNYYYVHYQKTINIKYS